MQRMVITSANSVPVIWYSRLVAHVSSMKGWKIIAHPLRQPGPGRRLAGPVAPWRRPPHRIVVVGGGAGGLELATRLGNKLGRRGKAHVTLIDKARTHLWKPLLHEIAAGSMDEDMHAIDYLAQAYWHGFVYRAGEMAGIDRARRVVQVAPFVDDEGRQVTPRQEVGYDTLVIAIGSLTNDFGTPGVKEHAIALETAGGGGPLPSPPGQRLHPRQHADRAAAARAAARRHHRRRARRAPSWRPSCTRPRASSSPSGSTASTPTRTSRST